MVVVVEYGDGFVECCLYVVEVDVCGYYVHDYFEGVGLWYFDFFELEGVFWFVFVFGVDYLGGYFFW